MRAGYFGPAGTFTHEALLAATAAEPVQALAYPTIHDTVLAVQEGAVDLAVVPIENSLEGSVDATLDALALEAVDVSIVGELVHPIVQCLIARRELALQDVRAVVSHPQATAQCARFLRAELPGVEVISGGSTAQAVRMVSEHEEPWAAIGPRVAASLYGCVVLRAGVEDAAGNQTRFAWLSRRGARTEPPRDPAGGAAAHKTAIVFWGPGSDTAGWLVRCLSEISERSVNMTRIESRPRKQGLGRYMFFVDLEGSERDPAVQDGLAALRQQVEVLRVLGSFPAA